jgi:hypothetical protein
MQSAERWRPVPGWADSYQVSDAGRVRSVDRIVRRSDGRTQRCAGVVLAPARHPVSGYLYVNLKRHGSQRQRAVHRLVLEAFVGPCPLGMEGCHSDGDQLNNRLRNLRWDTPSNNRLDTVRHGTHAEARQVVCQRGHQLAGVNLLPAAVHRGHRGCLACNRAVTKVRRALGNRRDAKDASVWERVVQAQSDRIYAKITGGRVAC